MYVLRVDGSLEPTRLRAVQNSAVEKWSYVDVVGCYNGVDEWSFV